MSSSSLVASAARKARAEQTYLSILTSIVAGQASFTDDNVIALDDAKRAMGLPDSHDPAADVEALRRGKEIAANLQSAKATRTAVPWTDAGLRQERHDLNVAIIDAMDNVYLPVKRDIQRRADELVAAESSLRHAKAEADAFYASHPHLRGLL